MPLTIAIVAVVAACGGVILWNKKRHQKIMQQHSIQPEELHAARSSNPALLIFDVRQPLDLLAYPEIIPGAKRITPAEILARPALIPKEEDSVVYCTCPSDKTSREVLQRALERQLYRVKFLKGGLAGWKALGYPVEKYEEVFHLYIPSAAAAAN